MDTQENTVTDGSQSTPAGNTPAASVATPPVYFEVVPYRAKGDAEGFSYTTKQYSTITAAIEDLGEELALDVLNAEVSARIGMKARTTNGFLKLGEAAASERASLKAALLAQLVTKYPSKVIFSEADAQAWKPGLRELTIGGIQKKINEALKSSNNEEFQFWVAQLIAVNQRQQAAAQS